MMWKSYGCEMRLFLNQLRIHPGMIFGTAALAALLAVMLIWLCDAWVEAVADERCHGTLEVVPEVKAALVLGCSPQIAGRSNLFFAHRMKAASQLYRSGKIKALILSGDNGSHDYDEPTAMKMALLKLGVPEEAIYCDYAGFRTLDSIVRAHHVFGQSRFLIVSQRFHNQRAVFLAHRHGLDAEAYNADDVPMHSGAMTYLREYLARVQAVLDVTILQTKPKFGGPPVELVISEPLPVK